MSSDHFPPGASLGASVEEPTVFDTDPTRCRALMHRLGEIETFAPPAAAYRIGGPGNAVDFTAKVFSRGEVALFQIGHFPATWEEFFARWVATLIHVEVAHKWQTGALLSSVIH